MRFNYHTNWHSSYLGEIVDYCGGGTPSTKNKSYWNGNIPWISSSDLYEDDIYKINKTRFITEQAIQNSATKLCPKESICVVSRVGVGKVAVTQQELCTSQDFFNIIKCNINKYFFAYQIQQKIKIAQQQGTSIKGITSKEIQNFKIWIPSENEQDKISFFLKLIDRRIQTQIKIIENLYSQRKCIFLQLNNNYQHNKIKINELGPVSIANNLSKDDLVDDGRECILYGELFTKYDLYTTHVISKTNKTYHTITSSGNDLLFPTSTTVNAISLIKPLALCQKDVILGGDMFSIKLNDTYDAIYISCLINSVYKKQLASKTQGTTIVHLYYENIKNEIIEICDYEIQCKIAKYIKFITSKIETEKELLNKLYLQKAYLLRNLFI